MAGFLSIIQCIRKKISPLHQSQLLDFSPFKMEVFTELQQTQEIKRAYPTSIIKKSIQIDAIDRGLGYFNQRCSAFKIQDHATCTLTERLSDCPYVHIDSFPIVFQTTF